MAESGKGKWVGVAVFGALMIGIAYVVGGMKPQPAGRSAAVEKAIGDYETAKAIKDKNRSCFLAGVVVSTMIAERDTAGAREWRETEHYVCQFGP